MRICGFNKTTLLDYPGKVAASLFLGGCNFRCPFCQNSELVLSPAEQPELDAEEIFAFLKKRRGILDGVCVSGGEPTLAPELPELLSRIKSLGYAVKLDTNGTNPDLVRRLVTDGLIDKVAMDIKSSRERYSVLCGVSGHLDAIEQSVEDLLGGLVEYEFRTTVVKELHSLEDFCAIGQWLKGAREYYLQAYRDSEQVIQPGFSSYTFEELQVFKKELEKTIEVVGIRGIE